MDYTVSVETYPGMPVKGTVPDWFWKLLHKDSTLFTVMSETYKAKDASLIMLATVGLRVALDRATVFLGMDSKLPLENKISGLQEGGFISATMKDELDVVASAGNAAAHRSWSPNAEQFSTFLTLIETFILAAVINRQLAIPHAASIPPRETRRGQARAERSKKREPLEG